MAENNQQQEEKREYLLPGEKKKLQLQSQLEKDFRSLQKSVTIEKEFEKDSFEDMYKRFEKLEPKEYALMTNAERKEYE